MSQIPKFGSGRPVIRTTNTVTTKTPAGGTKTVTNTTLRELLPCSARGQNASKGGCQPCPSTTRESIGQPRRPTGIRPPGTYRPAQTLGPPPRPQPMRAPAPQFRQQAPPSGFSRQVGQQHERSATPAAPSGVRRPLPQACPSAHVQRGQAPRMNIPGQAAPSQQMTEREKRIRQTINARGLEKLHPQLLKDFMKETKLEYRKVTQNAGINLKVKDETLDQFTITEYKFLGKTDRYGSYLCIRKQLSIRWVLHYPIMRQFLANCEATLPHSLFNIDVNKVVDIEELRGIFKEKVFYASCTLQDFHKSFCKLLDQKSDAVFLRKPLKFLPACTGLLSRYISKCIANTMTNIVKEKPPYLNLHVDFTSKLVVYPQEEEVVESFYTLLDDLISIGVELGAMERGRVKGCETKKIWLCLTEEFVKKCKNTIKDNIKILYQPVLEYLTNLEKEFMVVYSDLTCDLVSQASDVLFKDGCQRIDFYRTFISKVTLIPDNEYFNIGQLDLTLYREKLQSKLSSMAESIFNNLSAQHLWEVNDICDTFQLIKTRAHQKPSTTEELIEIGKFMAWIRNEHLDELNSRVYEALRSLSQLITIGILDSDHISRNSEAINWTESIIPIIEAHSITFEQLKFEAEDTLQRVIEEINVLITNTYPLLVILDEMDDIKLARTYLNKITLHMAKIKEIQLQIEWINKEEMCLNFPKSSYPEFDNLKDYVYPFYHLLKLSLDVQKHVSVWQHGQFDLLDYTKASEMVEKYSEELEDVKKLYRKKLRQAQDENLAIRFKGTVDDPDILNWPAPLKLCGMSLNVLEEFKPSLIVMKIMCNKALRARHWRAMSDIAGFNLMPNAGTTLKKMVGFNLQDKLKEFEIISVCATKEEELLLHLNHLKSQWDCVSFTVTQNQQPILDNLDDIQDKADQDIVEISKMFSSVFVRPFLDDVKSFLNVITSIQKVFSDWKVFQKVYLELQPVVFSVSELSTEKNQFLGCQSVYDQYINLMKVKGKIVDVVLNTNIAEDLKVSLATLKQVQKGVDEYLDEVRMKFPRLFLISDQELIELIPFKYCSPNVFQKTFPGLNHLKTTNSEVSAVCSKYGEELILKNPVKLTDKVEEIFSNLNLEIAKSVKHKIAECYKIFKKTPIKDLLKKYPEQALQVITKVFWTDNAEIGLKLPHNIKLLLLKKKIINNIEDKVLEIRGGQLNNLLTKIFKNLLLADLNLKYLLDSLMIDGKVINHEHFDWQKQLKFYVQESVCTVKFLDYCIDYGYEYLGNQQTVAITPQTERCYITLLLAYVSGFHGFLRGQEGKSVTAKSLALLLGYFYVNFHCISALTSECLRKFLKGVVMTGCWLGLKEIDRLKEEVMSSITQELGNILECKKARKSKITFDFKELNFNCRTFVIAQMEAKVKLPENFKLLFRTFTMSQPNLEVITESLLTVEGVEHPKECSERLCSTLELLQDLIGVEIQSQFRFKQVKQIVKQLQRVKLEQPQIHHLKALALSIREVFSPGLSHQNLKLLEQTLEDTFQDFLTELPCTLLNLDCDFIFTRNYKNKMEQVYQTLNSKKTLILLGDTYTGKSTVLKLCSQICQHVSLHIFNPKTITYPDLIGKVSGNPNLTWSEGVLLKIMRQSSENQKWILFDGNVEEGWCTDLVEMLGDKELLLETLKEEKLEEDVSFVFECTSLEKCSPALTSRCTTVYFPPDTLHYDSIIDTLLSTWKSDFKTDHQHHVTSVFKWFLPACLETIKNLEIHIELHENALVKNILTYFQLLLDEAHANNSYSKKEEDLKNHPTWIHASLIQAGVLGFSSVMTCDSIVKFDEFYKQLWKGVNPNYPYPKFLEKLEVGIPTDGLLLDHFYLYKQRGTWKLWSDLLKNEKIVESPYLNGWIVPTVDTIKCNFFLDLHVKHNKKLVIVGAKNCGKSLTLQHCSRSNLEECSFITIGRHLSAKKFQGILLRKLNKVSTSCYRPQGKKCICFLDDLHLNSLDSNELLRQHLDHQVWYDLNSWAEITLEGMVFMAAATSSRYHKLCQRVLKHFNVFGLNAFTEEGLSRIYTQSLSQTWKKSGFPADVLSAIDQIVEILLQVFNKLSFKPSLVKPQYSFDLKSIAKIVQGCTYLKKETYDSNKKVYLKVFVHEMVRVFTDPLTPEDTSAALETIKKVVEEHLPEDAVEIFSNDWDRMFFSRFLAKNINCYEEVNWQVLKDGCEQHLQDFNRTSSVKLDLIFFDYALEQIAKLCRLIHFPAEHCVLFGLTGLGRQSLSKFSAYLSEVNFVQPAYSSQSLTEDFKLVLKQCGGLNHKSVFFLSEEQLQSDDEILQTIDHYLRDGDITDLFNSQEQQEILEITRLAAQGGNKNLDITTHKVFLYFNQMCRQNLHLVLSFDVQSPKLGRRIADFPTLIFRTNPTYWSLWPDTALQTVAEHFLTKIPLDMQGKVAEVAVQIYKVFPGATPNKFWHFNTLFVDLTTRKQQELKQQREKFQKGLAKLSYAANQILDMQKVLAEYQPLLEDMTQNAMKMTEQIALETSQVEKASALVRTDEKIAHNQAAVAQVLKSECESELAQAIPILEDAISALNTLKPSDITLVKSMKNPPDAIKLVMASVCVIKEVKPDKIPDASTGRKTLDYWGPSKRILGDMNFLQSLKDFDKDHIKPEIIAKIRKDYLPHKDFKPHVVAKASSAAEGLCKWIIAMDMYDKVAKEVAPKKVKLDKAEREYAETMKILNEKKEEVVRIEEKLAQLKALLEEATKKQEKLQHEVDLCNIKLESAQNLMESLSSDKQRWTEASENLQNRYENLAGDVLLCSALVAYAAELHEEARTVNILKCKEYITELGIPATNQNQFKFTSILTPPPEAEAWLEQLSKNNFSMENALIYFTSRQLSIFNDPHGQAIQWLLNSESGNSLVVTKFTYHDWLPEFKQAISSGRRILIKDTTGHLPTSLKNYLCGYTRVVPDGTVYVTIDQEELSLHRNSKVYIVCCKPSSSYSPEIHSKVTVINFSLTSKALEDDLLKTLVEIEKPEIRKKTAQLVETDRENDALIERLELKILDTLCESQVDILEDEASILILDKSKELGKIALDKQTESRLIAEEIDSFKQDYFEVARYVSKLFFCIEALQKLHCKYQYSLKWFKEVYFMSILNSGKSKVVETRCVNICQAFSFDLFKHVSKGLFVKHKLLFTFWMALHSTQEPPEEFFAVENMTTKPLWISDGQWQDLLHGSSIQTLNVTPYQQLLLAKTFKPENLTKQIKIFIKHVLGEIFLQPSFFNMQDTYNDSNSLMPITFILTPGLDVLGTLNSFARIKQVLHKFHYLSLDGFNSNRAEDLIKHSQKEGSWVLLQNCQYTGKWLFQLERHLEGLDFENTHENFRLFLTTVAEHEFPLEVIQNCVKIVNEPSSRLKENLLETYTKPPVAVDDYYYSCSSHQVAFSRLLYRLCCFHFVLKARKVIQATESDLNWSLNLLKTFISDESNLYQKVDYIIGHCIYNSYLEGLEDKLLLSKLLQGYVNPTVVSDKSVAVTRVPIKKDRRDYLVYINKLPEETPPEALYLTQQQLLDQHLLETAEFLENGSTLSGCFETTNQLNPKDLVEDLQNALPNYILGDLKVQGHIKRERDLYQTLLQTIQTTLVNLSSFLDDGESLPEDLEDLLQDLYKHQVPKMWFKVCYPTVANLGSFMSHLNENVQFIKRYAIKSTTPVLLRALYFPRVILALAKLDFAKKYKAKIEHVDLVYKVFDNLEMQKGVVFEGLVLNGAGYSLIEDRIVELPPKTSCTQLPFVGCEAVIQIEVTAPTCPVRIFKTAPSDNQRAAEELFNQSSPEVLMVEEEVAHELMERSMRQPDEAVFSKSQHVEEIGEQQMIQTPAGMEPLLQQTYNEKRVERDDVAERVVKNVVVTDMDESGQGTRITISEQQLDPDYGLPSEEKDVVTVRETVSITPSYTSTAKDVRHEVTKSKIHIDPQELAKMVEEEYQDVENTLRMVPPDLPLNEDRYAVKKRLQKLRLNTESMILLEESVINPVPTADEVIVETPPEALANIMHTVESGVTPECPPDQIFHTLFEEKSTEQSVILSSIGPGPLQDVVIPQVLTKDIHKESMTPDLTDLTNLYKNVTDAKDWPPVDIFASVMDDAAKSVETEVTAIPFQPLQDEEMPWADEDLEPLVNIVGAEPGVVLDPAHVPDLDADNLVQELSKGIEYLVNADPVQYMSRVQLRGTQPPPWFPGYIYALPEFPDVVKLARSPDEVFISSWKSCQPKLIPDESFSILN